MGLISGYTNTSDTEQLTWAKLQLMFSDGSATIDDQSQITPGVITVSPTAPTGKTGDGWFDTSLGSGYGVLRIFDGSDWKPVAEGFIGLNNGLAVSPGAPMRIDSSVTTAQTGGRIAVVRGTISGSSAIQTQRMIGIAGTSMANGEIGVVLTRGKAKIFKDTANITAGDPVVISNATNAQATTNAVGSWGTPFGSASPGQWLESSTAAAGTLVTADLVGPTLATWIAFKSTPATLLNAGTPSGSSGDWQTAISFSTSPAGTVAHLLGFLVTDTTTTTQRRTTLGFRANGSSLTVATGAVCMTADVTYSTTRGLQGTLWVPQGTSDDKFQWVLENSAGTFGQMRVTIFEVGVMVGGQVV